MSSAPTATVTGPGTPDPKPRYNPEEHRMTIGEHLEELRKRLFLGVGGFFLAFIVFMVPSIGEHVVYYVCRPLFIALARNKVSIQIYFTDPAEVFMTYIKAAMISAVTIAGPWIIYQIWLFVAAPSSVIEIDDVFDARMTSGRVSASSLPNNARLVSAFSTIASTT